MLTVETVIRMLKNSGYECEKDQPQIKHEARGGAVTLCFEMKQYFLPVPALNNIQTKIIFLHRKNG